MWNGCILKANQSTERQSTVEIKQGLTSEFLLLLEGNIILIHPQGELPPGVYYHL